MPLRSIQVIVCTNSPCLRIAESYFMALAVAVALAGQVGCFVFCCSSLRRGRLVLLQAAELWEFLVSSQDPSPLSVITHAQQGKGLHAMNWLFSRSFLPILQVLRGPSPFLRSFCVDNHLSGQAPAAPIVPCVLCLCAPGSGPSKLN